MKRYLVHIAVGMSVAVAALSCAEHPLVPKPTPGATVTGKGEIAPLITDFEGTISRVDAGNGIITVDHWPLSKAFKVPPDCRIDISTDATATLSQLKSGDAVIVTYAGTGKDLVASRIIRRGKEYDQERNEKMERLDEMLNPSPNQ